MAGSDVSVAESDGSVRTCPPDTSLGIVTRLFVAIWPNPEAITAVAAHVERVRPSHPQLRWQPPERWHLTCAFLGAAEVERTVRSLDRLLAAAPASGELRISGAGSFGSVLWLGVEHGQWLTTLARRIQRGLRTPDQRFRGHITVARGRGRDAHRIVKEAVPDLAAQQGPPWTPSEVTLVESVTGPAPRYTVLHTWPLTPEPDT